MTLEIHIFWEIHLKRVSYFALHYAIISSQ